MTKPFKNFTELSLITGIITFHYEAGMSEALETEFLDRLYTDLQEDKLVLPTLPEMALRIRDIVSDPNCSLANVARCVVRDPALPARLIQIANSPLLRARNPIETVEMAVMRMGGVMIKNIVTSVVMEQLFQATTDLTQRKLRSAWQHSSEVSSLAVVISYQHPHLHADQAMLAGLVHDIGILPVLTLAEEYPQLLKDEERMDRLLQEAHARIGRSLLLHWNFPDALVNVAAEHDNLEYQSEGPADYVDLVIAANLQSTRNTALCRQLGDLSAIPAFARLGLGSCIEVVDMEAAAVVYS